MKEFSCTCGSKKFRLIKESKTLVDFGREGAIEGHPALSFEGEEFIKFWCVECGRYVPHSQGLEMLQEVL